MAGKNLKIVFLGAGAIGGSVGGWIAPHYDNLYFLDQGATAAALKEKGITLYHESDKDAKTKVKVKVLDGLDQAKDADVIVLAVKNFSLDKVAKLVHEKLGDRPVIVSMANGVENQRVLPRYFSRVIYCVISYNAWLDAPGVIGYQKKGPLIFGTLKNELQDEMKAIAEVFNRGVETIIVPHIQDAAHCKMVVNLANSATTLMGHKFREISDMALYQKILTNLLLEGVNIIKAAGFRECKLGGMPSWRTIWVGVHMPRFISGPIFRKNVKKMNISSMAQDVLVRKSTETELDTINGCLVELAARHKVPAPFNKTIYEICKAEFAKPGFQPWDVKDVWQKIERAI